MSVFPHFYFSMWFPGFLWTWWLAVILITHSFHLWLTLVWLLKALVSFHLIARLFVHLCGTDPSSHAQVQLCSCCLSLETYLLSAWQRESRLELIVQRSTPAQEIVILFCRQHYQYHSDSLDVVLKPSTHTNDLAALHHHRYSHCHYDRCCQSQIKAVSFYLPVSTHHSDNNPFWIPIILTNISSPRDLWYQPGRFCSSTSDVFSLATNYLFKSTFCKYTFYKLTFSSLFFWVQPVTNLNKREFPAMTSLFIINVFIL